MWCTVVLLFCMLDVKVPSTSCPPLRRNCCTHFTGSCWTPRRSVPTLRRNEAFIVCPSTTCSPSPPYRHLFTCTHRSYLISSSLTSSPAFASRMATKYGFRSSTFVILSKFYFFPPFHVNFCLHFGTLCRIPSFIAHARKSKFFSSRVEKKVAAPKFGDVFIGANGEKQSKAAGELADPCDPFSSIPPPPPSRATESPAAAEGEFMSREDLKKKHEFNEKEQVEPFLATYLDVAVLRCLFTSQWIEEGIEWALHFLFRRLEAISKYREKRRETLFRSSSLPTPKRKSGERNQTESKSCRPKNTDSNNEASIGANGENTQLKTGASGFQESRRSSFSGLPGMSA